MKKIILLSLIALFALQLSAQNKSNLTTFVLVRHAEKVLDKSNDPALTAAGKDRAERLSKMFASAEISAIYSTPYVRTQQTVAPLAAHHKLGVESYQPKDLSFLKAALKEHKGDTIVVSGHSNTIPYLVNELIGEDKFKDLDDSEYDKIFIVSVTKVGKGKVVVLSF